MSSASLTSTLLETWRKTFDPAVGALLESWATAQATPLEDLPLKKKERAAELARLAKTAGDAERTPVLLAFEAFARDATGALVWPAVEAWAEVEPDPRVARMALRTLVALEHQLTGKLWRRLVGCLERHGDVGVVNEAAPYLATLEEKGGGWGFSVERFNNVLRKLERTRAGTPLSKPELKKLEVQAGGAKSKSKSSTDDEAQGKALLDAILAAPADDAARAVYADWLLERRLPLGEFIALQLHRKPTPTQRKREAQVLASHRGALLGPFDGVVATKSAKFERGFLVEAEALTPLPVTPLTRLLRSVTFKRGVGKKVDLAGLEHAQVSDDFVVELFAAAPALKSVTFAVTDANEFKTMVSRRLESLTLLHVGRYAMEVPAQVLLRQTLASPCGRSLRHLRVEFGSTVPPLEPLQLPASLESLTLSGPAAGTVVLTRHEGVWSLGFRIETNLRDRAVTLLTRVVDALRLDCAIVVSSGRPQREEMEPALSAALKARKRAFTWTTD